MTDPELKLRVVGGGGGGCFTCPAGFPSFCHLFFFIQNKEGEEGAGPPGPSPRSTTGT